MPVFARGHCSRAPCMHALTACMPDGRTNKFGLDYVFVLCTQSSEVHGVCREPGFTGSKPEMCSLRRHRYRFRRAKFYEQEYRFFAQVSPCIAWANVLLSYTIIPSIFPLYHSASSLIGGDRNKPRPHDAAAPGAHWAHYAGSASQSASFGQHASYNYNPEHSNRFKPPALLRLKGTAI